MKIFFLIFFLSYFSNAAFAQSEKKFDMVFCNVSHTKYFRKNPSIRRITFHTGSNGLYSVSIYSKTIWQDDESANYINRNDFESYNLNFSGDLYLLNKKYIGIDFSEKEFEGLSKKYKCPYWESIGITPDSIHLQVTYYNCATKPVDPDEIIFEKVEITRRYDGGVRGLKKYLEESIKTQDIVLSDKVEDSVLIYSVVLGKDSVLKRIEQIEGNYSSFSQSMMDALINSGQWFPSIQGGRSVKSYFKIFVRLNKDKTLTVSYPE